MTDQASSTTPSEDKQEKKILHFDRPQTQKEAYWEERCKEEPRAAGCLIYDD
jgi:hypothetical protein